MVVKSIGSIDKQIVEMRKKKYGLYRLHKWLSQWSSFSQLDEMITLANVLNILNKNNLAVSRNEVRNCFNRFYKREFHGDKKSYLAWLYNEFHVKKGAVVQPKRSHRVISSTKIPFSIAFFRQTNNSPTKQQEVLKNEE